MTNSVAIILGTIIVIIGTGTLIYAPMARLVNIPGDNQMKAFGAIMVGIIIIIVVGFML